MESPPDYTPRKCIKRSLSSTHAERAEREVDCARQRCGGEKAASRCKGLTSEKAYSLSCGRCKNILYLPVIAGCCRGSLCKGCLVDAVVAAGACPLCTAACTAEQAAKAAVDAALAAEVACFFPSYAAEREYLEVVHAKGMWVDVYEQRQATMKLRSELEGANASKAAALKELQAAFFKLVNVSKHAAVMEKKYSCARERLSGRLTHCEGVVPLTGELVAQMRGLPKKDCCLAHRQAWLEAKLLRGPCNLWTMRCSAPPPCPTCGTSVPLSAPRLTRSGSSGSPGGKGTDGSLDKLVEMMSAMSTVGGASRGGSGGGGGSSPMGSGPVSLKPPVRKPQPVRPASPVTVSSVAANRGRSKAGADCTLGKCIKAGLSNLGMPAIIQTCASMFSGAGCGGAKSAAAPGGSRPAKVAPPVAAAAAAAGPAELEMSYAGAASDDDLSDLAGMLSDEDALSDME